MMTIENVWDELVETGDFTNAELQLVTALKGYTINTLNDAIYVRYGQRDWKQRNEER